MAEYSSLYLRRFSKDILPFLSILVMGESRGANQDVYKFFDTTFGNKEFIAISEDQKNSKEPLYCMYLVNFHDFVESMLHVNVQAIGRDTGTVAYTQQLLRGRKILTHMESTSPLDLAEMCKEFYAKSGANELSHFNTILDCLHLFYTHILILNIEIQLGIQRIANNASSTRRNQLLATSVCVSPELPTYLAAILHAADRYCAEAEDKSPELSLESLFTRETNIGFNSLSALKEYEMIQPIVGAYAATSQHIADQSVTIADICNKILNSELWQKERST